MADREKELAKILRAYLSEVENAEEVKGLLKIKSDEELIQRFKALYPPSIYNILQDMENHGTMIPLLLFSTNTTTKYTAKFLSKYYGMDLSL